MTAPDHSQERRFTLLREALPYIQRFKGKVFVVKLSGKLTQQSEALLSLAEEIAVLVQVGFRVVVVHGGGPQLTRLAERLGVPQQMVEGRRITDTATLEMAKMVFAGQVRSDVLSVFRRMGVPSVGLSGLDADILRARRREARRVTDRETGKESWVDYGHVGEIVEVDGRLLKLLLDNGYLPVISCLGADENGRVYNINADTVASEIAVHLGAEKLILASDVDGVYRDADDPSSKIPLMTLDEVRVLIESGELQGGMIPKLRAVVDLLAQGVRSAHIINGLRPDALLQEIFTDTGTGTMVTVEAGDSSGPSNG